VRVRVRKRGEGKRRRRKGGGEALEKERVQEGHHFLKCLIPPQLPPPNLE
jgi:hypothetical protein